MVWGNGMEAMLERSMASLREFHPELPVHVHRDEDSGVPWQGLLLKAGMARHSPFEQTLFLDADTTILGKLDYGFEMAERHGLACTLCESPWARRHTGLRGEGDLVEFNTGVLFFGPRSRHVFDAWERLAPVVDSSTVFVSQDGTLCQQLHDDQASFALAVKESGFVPFTLPLNWNYRPNIYRTFCGPLKIWHCYEAVPEAVRALCKQYLEPDAFISLHELSRGRR
jgi:hypothetical protein